MSEPSGYLLHGTAFSSKEAAFEILVHNHEQELRFHKLWDEDAQPYYFESQPQLTIPKSIADEIDKFAHTNWANWQFYFYSDEMSKELIDWFDNGDSEFTNSKIAMVYLNPLTRDLVKVVEG